MYGFRTCFKFSLLVLLTIVSQKSFGAESSPITTVEVKRAARPLDFVELLGNERVIYIGENHGHRELKSLLVRHLPDFAKLGVTHLGIEMLESNDQSVLDRFMAGSATPEELQGLIEKNWGWIPKENLELLIAARNQGIKIVALDLPDHKLST